MIYVLPSTGTISQLGVTIGLLLSQILGLPSVLGTHANWPTLLGEHLKDFDLFEILGPAERQRSDTLR